MKKLFAFSVLSMLAVMGVAQAELAGKGFVTAGRINQELYGYTKNENVVRSTGQAVGGWTDISDKVEESPDSYIPTIARMENYVDSEISAKVGTSQVITSSGTDLGGNQVADSVSSDAVVPTLKTVEENFVPNIADEYYDGYENQGLGDGDLEMMLPGDYVLTVTVDESGVKRYVWRAMNIGVGESSVVGDTGIL